MATRQSEEALVQVATRVPAELFEAVRRWCVQHGVSVMAFVAGAVRYKLRRTRIRRA